MRTGGVIRISKQKRWSPADISTYLVHEVEALGTARACSARRCLVVYDGFLPDEVKAPTSTRWRPTTALVPGHAVKAARLAYEGGQQNKDTAQRIVFPIEIAVHQPAGLRPDPRRGRLPEMTLTAIMRDFTCITKLGAEQEPPTRGCATEIRLGSSLDLRAFSTRPGGRHRGVIHGPD